MVFDLDHKRVCNPVLEGTSGLSVYDSGEVVCAYVHLPGIVFYCSVLSEISEHQFKESFTQCLMFLVFMILLWQSGMPALCSQDVEKGGQHG